MQNSTKISPARLACLIMIFFCANYGSMYAQGERKAFEEGDKIIGFTVGRGYGSHTGLNGSLGASYEKAIEGTRGILSIGGFANYSSGYQNFLNRLPVSGFDTYYARVNEISAGIKIGAHYATRKWDFYGGIMVGASYGFRSDGLSNSADILSLRPLYQNPLDKFNINVNPYVGARYYISKKVGFQLETTGKQTTFGIVFKF
jgi:hypothetical protein